MPIIASGGVGNLDHLADGVLLGAADAVLAASIFHFGEYTIREAKRTWHPAALRSGWMKRRKPLETLKPPIGCTSIRAVRAIAFGGRALATGIPLGKAARGAARGRSEWH